MSLGTLLTFLEAHRLLMYGVLFAGAYFETFIITSFFIYGEFFFIAGGILAGTGVASITLVTLVLSLGGILGDQSSYVVGRLYGDTLYRWFERVPLLRRTFTRKNRSRGLHFFRQYGGLSVLVGRFLGPVSWITPFLAGLFELPYVRFTAYGIPAAVLGIGQFIIVGYIFGASYTQVLAIMQQYFLLVVFAAVVVGLVLYVLRRTIQRMESTIRLVVLHFFLEVRRGNVRIVWRVLLTTFWVSVTVFLLYVLMLIMIFFVENQRIMGTLPPDLSGTYASADAVVKSITATTYYKKGTSDVEPVNVVVITDQPIDNLLRDSHWIDTSTFARGHISFTTFLHHAEQGQLPISDLYFKAVPQNSAYEYASSTWTTREHVRIWNYGTIGADHVYVLSASKDIGLDIYRSLSFIVPYHRIDPYVDNARDFTVNTLLDENPGATVESYPSPLGPRVQTEDNDSMYVTDGTVTVVHI